MQPNQRTIKVISGEESPFKAEYNAFLDQIFKARTLDLVLVTDNLDVRNLLRKLEKNTAANGH